MKDNYVDINFSGKMKSKFVIDDLFTKIESYLKKNKIDNLWNCEKHRNVITINFNDGISGIFTLDIIDNKFNGDCRVYYDNSTVNSTLEKLLDMFFAVKNIFSKFDINDDYSICESYLKNKEIKIQLLDLNEQQVKDIKSIYDEGYKEYKELLLMYIARSLNLDSYKELYININVLEFTGCETIEKVYEQMVLNVLETWLYETTEYKNNKFYNNEFYNIHNKAEYRGLGNAAFDMYACCHGIQRVISKKNIKSKSFGIKDAQIQKFYSEIVLNMLNEQNNQFEKCMVVIKYLFSIMKYTGFKFVGKDEKRNSDKHCTTMKYINNVISIKDALNNILN